MLLKKHITGKILSEKFVKDDRLSVFISVGKARKAGVTPILPTDLASGAASR